MTMMRIALVGALSFSAACGGGGDDGVRHDTDGLSPSPVSATSGAAAANTTAGLNAAFAGGGDSAATGVMDLNGAAMGLAIGGSARQIPRSSFAPTNKSKVAGDCICDETGCTFDQCGTEESYITGSVTIDVDHYVWDLQFVGNSEYGEFELAYVGDLTVTDVLVDGSASATGGGSFSNEGQTIDLELDWELGFNAIALDPACDAGPVGGSLDVFSRFSASANGQSGGYYAEGSIAFGPGCGEVVAN